MGFFDLLVTAGKDVRNRITGLSTYSVTRNGGQAPAASDLEELEVDDQIEQNIHKLTAIETFLDEMKQSVSKCIEEYSDLKRRRDEMINTSLFGPSIPNELDQEAKNLMAIGDMLSNKKKVDVSAVNKALDARQRKMNLRKRKVIEPESNAEYVDARESEFNNNEVIAKKKIKKENELTIQIDAIEEEGPFSDVNLEG